MDETDNLHSMTYAERESLKDFARRGQCLDETLIMITQWMRVAQDVTFFGYASNWAEAHRTIGNESMRKQWPLRGLRFIADGSSEWGSAVN